MDATGVAGELFVTEPEHREIFDLQGVESFHEVGLAGDLRFILEVRLALSVDNELAEAG